MVRRSATSALAAALAASALTAAALPARAQAACSLSIVLTPCIQATWPGGSVALGTVNAGTTTISPEQLITVSANQSWGIRISSDLANGRMREWTGSAYATPTPRTLSQPLQWARSTLAGVPQTPSWASLSSTPAAVVSGRGATGCVLGALCGVETTGVKFRLTTGFSDRRAAPNSYRILVTYDASLGF